jgi:hypothetical protein
VILLSLFLLAAANPVLAVTRYVNLNNPAPAAPYTTWASAATNIQDAIDAALPGDDIVVTNGVYATGGREQFGSNRVAVTKPVTLGSVNGPEVTTIDGLGAVRCMYLTNGATLIGFTLTKGTAGFAGGIWSADAVVSNCVLVGNSASEAGGAVGGTYDHCTFSRNSAREGRGGGVFEGTLNNCTLSNNSAGEPSRPGLPDPRWFGYGGGAYLSTLSNCIISDNAVFPGYKDPIGPDWASGGGAMYCTLDNCTLSGNSAEVGGGACGSTLMNCILRSNSALIGSGAAPEYWGTEPCILSNCTLSGHSRTAVVWATLNNCTIVGNGRGVEGGCVTNCIVYGNTENYGASTLTCMNFTCTFPSPTNGTGNLTNEPAFVDAGAGNYRLRPGSPCIDAGTDLSATLNRDLDGRPRPLDGNGDGIAAFDMGAYESGVVWPPFSRLALQRIASFDLQTLPRSLIEGRDGCLYGTTSTFIQHPPYYTNGLVFKLTRSGTLTVLTSFPPGDVPEGLVEAADGNVYCATRRFFEPLCGSIVRVTPAGERTNVFNFDGANGCFADDLIAAPDGNLYGLVFSRADGFGLRLSAGRRWKSGDKSRALQTLRASDGAGIGTNNLQVETASPLTAKSVSTRG